MTKSVKGVKLEFASAPIGAGHRDGKRHGQESCPTTYILGVSQGGVNRSVL